MDRISALALGLVCAAALAAATALGTALERAAAADPSDRLDVSAADTAPDADPDAVAVGIGLPEPVPQPEPLALAGLDTVAAARTTPRAPPPATVAAAAAAAPAWAWGGAGQDPRAMYEGWAAYAATQGADAGPALEFARFLARQRDPALRQQALDTAADRGDWRVVWAALAEGVLPLASDEAVASARQVLARCASHSSECAYAEGVLRVNPDKLAALTSETARQAGLCGIPVSFSGLIRMANVAPSPTPWCVG